MRTSMLAPALLLVGALAPRFATPPTAAAQTVSVRPAPRGWVGISYEITQDPVRGVSVLVTDVRGDSPAQRAGIEVGDVLVSLNGQGVDTNFGDVPLRVRPGDRVDVVLTRLGRPHRLALVAGERPPELAQTASVTVTVAADSIVESMFRAMDSLRLTFETPGGRRSERIVTAAGDGEATRGAVVSAGPDEGWLRIEAIPPGRAEPDRVDVLPPELEERFTLSEVRAPFGFWVFRTQAHDSLLVAMESLNRDIRQLRVRESDRMRRLVGDSGSLASTERDAELERLSDVLEPYTDRSTALKAAMDRAAREAAEPRTGYTVAWRSGARGEPASVETDPGENTFFGPLTAYALGQNRVAGAEVLDLRRELADYFRVDGGVLVVDVLPGTPAASAGLRPGDVLTHVDRVPIQSLTELRVAVERAADGLPLTLVRRGRPLHLLLRR